MNKKYESSLRTQSIQEYTWDELLKFTFERKSFFRDYKLLHAKDEGEVNRRLKYVVYVDPKSLAEEIRLCFNAAIQMESRQTYYFNLFVVDLIERYYSDAIYYENKKEMKAEYLISQDDPSPISFEWVLEAGILNPYQRYLLFEYLALGYSLEALGRRRHCTSRTIENHLNQIIEVLDSPH
jgi:hypothetical protein